MIWLTWRQARTQRLAAVAGLGLLALYLVVLGTRLRHDLPTCAHGCAGAVAALLTWAASPLDQVTGDRFTALLFGTRNLAPIADAIFAFTLGTALGSLLRRTVAALAPTLLFLVVVEILMPTLVRSHLSAPTTVAEPMTAERIRDLRFLGIDADIGLTLARVRMR